MEIVVAEKVAEKVVEEVIDSVWRQIRYILNYKTNIEELRKKVELLQAERESVQHQVKTVSDNLMEIEQIVEIWLQDADDAIEAANQLLQAADEKSKGKTTQATVLETQKSEEKADETAKTSCFMDCHLERNTRYLLSRKAKKEMLPNVSDVIARNTFSSVGYRKPVQEMELHKNYEVIESRTQVLEKIVEALKDGAVSMIGLYGLGGIGKSTLLKQLTSHVKEDGLFKVVVTATVTHTPDRKEIQKQLAEWLDFSLGVDSVDIRATKLRSRLQKEEKILVILDDIWAENLIKLEDIGIPYGVDHKGCKVLMSSRNQDVLLQMNVKEDFSFKLETLDVKETISLFQKKVGTLKDPDQMQPILTDLAKMCGGIPLLIDTVASALGDREIYEWKDALDDLQRIDDNGLDGQFYKALMLSYKFLKEDQKSLFLLCSQLVPYSIPINVLLKYCIGLGLFNQRSRSLLTVQSVKNRLLTVVGQLKKCCLFESDRNDVVKMHDKVHEFAASVASHQYVFNGRYGTKLEVWPDDDSFEQCTAISLPHCIIPQLPQVLKCQRLRSFLLHNDDPSLKIPHDLFSKTKELSLIDLSNVNLLPLPSSLLLVENLATLCLDRCELEDISDIGKLKNLRVLSLIGSTISRLPKELSELTKLQLLDLSGSDRLEVIPQGILNRLTKLEHLQMGNSFVKWQDESQTGETENVNLDELKLLSNLINLEIQILDPNLLSSNLFSEKLEEFRIFVGDDWDWFGKYETSTTLKLKIHKSNQLDNIKIPLVKTEDLYLDDLKGFENVLPELDGQGFPKLKHFHIQNTHGTQYIIDWKRMGQVTAFGRLESLSLHNLNTVMKISHGKSSSGCFDNLKKIKVENCHELTNLFSFSMFKCLVQLQEISVRNCRSMKGIVAVINDDDEDKVDWKDETVELTKLRTLTLEELPQFASFCFQTAVTNEATREISLVHESENLTNKKIQFPSLVDLKLSAINLQWIWNDQMIELSPFAKLTTLIVDGCGKLAYMLPFAMVGCFRHLKHIEICNCNSMEEVITTKEVVEEVLFPKLDSLRLKGLPKLERFVSSNSINCPSLKELWIENCPQLLAFTDLGRGTSSRTTQGDPTLFDEKASFPSLEVICIRYMHRLKMIWDEELGSDSFCRLKVVEVEHCKELLKVFPSKQLRRFKNVEYLGIEYCDSLEEVFDFQMLMKSEENLTSMLSTLVVKELPELKQVWNGDSQRFLSFHNLSRVTVWYCPSLAILFPVSIGRNLRRLEELFIDICGIKEIITKEETETESTITFAFPQLKSLTLWRVDQLMSFCNGIHTLDCPQLKRLDINECDQLELFGFKHEDGQFQQPFLPLTMVGNLEEVSISSKEISHLRHGQFPIGFFHNLRAVQLRHFHNSAELPFDLLRNFHDMHTLQLTNIDFEDLFPNDDVGGVESTLARIRHLRLCILPCMKHVWKQDSEPLQFLHNLQTLDIWACNSLVSLKGFSASFHNLSALYLRGCEALVNVASCSAISGLVCLTTMTIEECQNMAEIIATREDDDKSQFQRDDIIFKKLQTLQLNKLAKLTSFCSAPNCTIKFPCLEQLLVVQCPNMKIFSPAVVFAPKLKRVYVTEDWNKSHWIGDLNTTINQIYTQMVGFNGLEHLKLSEYPQLKQVWLHQEQLPTNYFYNLSWLEIQEFATSSTSISSNLLPFLNNLETLEVKDCDSVEQVFGVPSSTGYDFSQYLTNLKELYLIGLPKLRCIFPSSMWGIVLNLLYLKIENCESVKVAFDFQELKTANINRTVKSKLRELRIKNLPNSRHIWKEDSFGSVSFDDLYSVKVSQCPSLDTIFPASVASNLPQLRTLSVDRCGVKELIAELEGAEATPRFVFPQLKKVYLYRMEKLKCFYKGNHTLDCPNLKKLKVHQCDNLQIFGSEHKDRKNMGIQPFFSFLQDSQPYQVLQALKTLEVHACNNLLRLAPSSASFGNLTMLDVWDCHGLVSLLTSSTAKSLVQLKKMEIKKCKELIGIIANEGDEEEAEEIVFIKLESLELTDLPSLICFCPEDHSFKFPALTKLTLEECPNVKFFCKGELATPNLEEVNGSKYNDENLNDTIHKLHTEQVFLDMPVLEDAQRGMLDNIESQVSSAVDHMQSGKTAVQRAKSLQKNSRKWMCIAIIILLIIVVIIVVAVIKPLNNKKGA